MDLDAPGRSARSKRSRYGDCWKEVVSVCRTSSDMSTSSSRAKSKDGICASSDDDGWEGVATVRRTTSARSASSVAEDRNDEDGSPRGGDGDANKGDDDVRSSGIVEDQATVESEPPAAAPSAPSEPAVTAAPTEEEAADAGPADEESNVLSPGEPAPEAGKEATPAVEARVDAKDDNSAVEGDKSAAAEETSNPSEPAVTAAPKQEEESTDVADDAVGTEQSRANEASLDEPEPEAAEAATPISIDARDDEPVDAKDDKFAAVEETKPEETKRAKRRPFAFPKTKRTVSWRKPKFLGRALPTKASLRDDENGRQRGGSRKDTNAVHGPAPGFSPGHRDQLEDRNDDQPEDRNDDQPEGRNGDQLELCKTDLLGDGEEDNTFLSEEILSEESREGPVIEVHLPENGESHCEVLDVETNADAGIKETKAGANNRSAGCVETLLLCGEEDSSSSESRSEELEDEAHVASNMICNMRTHEENEAEFWSSIFIEGLDWVKEGTAQLLPEEYRATTEMEGPISAESFATNVSAVATVIGEGLECGAELWSGAATAIERKKLERKNRRSGSRRTTKPRKTESNQDPLPLALREERERPVPRELDPFGNAEDPPNDVDKAACTAGPKEEDPASEVDAACTATPEEEIKTSRVDVPALPFARARSFERVKSIVRSRSKSRNTRKPNKGAGYGGARPSALARQPTGASLAMRSEAKRKVRQGKQPPTKSTKRSPSRKVDKYGAGVGDVF